MALAGITLTWAIPRFSRQMNQAAVEEYKQQYISGLYSLRARQGTDGTSCDIAFNSAFNFNSGGTFGSSEEILELNKLTTLQRNSRLHCCDDDANCWNNKAYSYWDKPYRYLVLEGTPASKKVKIAVSSSTYSLSPPGTSSTQKPLTLLFRSASWDQDPTRPLPTLCVELSSTGVIKSGQWEIVSEECNRV